MSLEPTYAPLTHPEGLPSAAQLTDEGLDEVVQFEERSDDGD